MIVDELRQLLAKLPGNLPVCVEVSAQAGNLFEGADLQAVAVEVRCDEVERLYLFGDQDDPQEPSGPNDEDWTDRAGNIIRLPRKGPHAP